MYRTWEGRKRGEEGRTRSRSNWAVFSTCPMLYTVLRERGKGRQHGEKYKGTIPDVTELWRPEITRKMDAEEEDTYYNKEDEKRGENIT